MSQFASLTDADLATLFRSGETDAFTGIYDRYADGLFSYSLGMVSDADEAAHATHDAFVHAAERLERNGAEVRTTVFSSARELLRNGAAGANGLGESGDGQTRIALGPVHIDAGEDTREEVWESLQGLGRRDRELFLLSMVEGLSQPEIEEVTGMDDATLDVLIERTRARAEKALGPLLLFKFGDSDCDELTELMDADDKFDVALRSRLARHLGRCESCSHRRAELAASPEALSSLLVVPAPDVLKTSVVDQVVVEIDPIPETAPMTPAEPPAPPPPAVPVARPVAAASAPDGPAMYALIVGVALVLGLIGLAVSARFDPLPRPVAAARIMPPTSSDGPTVTTEPSFAPSTTSATVATTAARLEPGMIEVGTETVDLGAEATTGQFEIVNTGGQPIEFTVDTTSTVLALSAAGQELGAGESATYEVTLDREAVVEGDISETILVSWDGASHTISVVGSQLDNPILHSPQASPSQVQADGGPGCAPTQTTISVRVLDRSPVEVVVRWSPDGGAVREDPMTGDGGDVYQAVIGPFTVAQTAPIRVVAVDELGNAGGAGMDVVVAPCP